MLHQSSIADLDQPERIVLENLVTFQSLGMARQLSHRHVFSYYDGCVYGFYGDGFYDGGFYDGAPPLWVYQIIQLYPHMPYQYHPYVRQHVRQPVLSRYL